MNDRENEFRGDGNQAFRIRPYSKRELAMLYFPMTKRPSAAVANLRNLMMGCKELMDELKACRYSSHCRLLTRRQVAVIVDYLGEP